MKQPTVRFDRREAVAYATLDHPDRLTAIEGAMPEACHAAFDAMADVDSVRDRPLPVVPRGQWNGRCWSVYTSVTAEEPL